MPGETVKCTYLNEEPTRSMGFWSTHYTLTRDTWQLIPSAERKLCTVDTKDLSSAASSNVPGVGMVPLSVQSMEGGFWSSIPKTSTKQNRSALDQARMQLVQQLLAAMLNVMMDQHAFTNYLGDGSEWFDTDLTLINNGKAAYCGTDVALILARAAELEAFNTGGAETPLPPGVNPAADPKTSKTVAVEEYWDPLP
jgi:hypothetical protein